MCGVAGILREGGLTEQDHTVLGRMNSVLRHRGPDAAGSWSDGTIALAHRRLSIIDLSPGANQPLADRDRQVWISFNGEIYNFAEVRQELRTLGYAFQTEGDAEVIVNAYRAWGIDAISRLRGMFAFALWDHARHRLLLVRDRLGKKPLYYHARAGCLVFASEIKAILEHPEISRQVDPSALDHFLTFAYVPSPLTMFAGIRRVPAAHVLVWERGECSLRKYWDPKAPEDGHPPSEAEAADRVLALLRESVRLRLVSDVPVGAFLSGGLDSSIVVALMAEQTGTVKTYSVGFTEDEFDELPHARTVARHFGTDHHEIRLTADVAKVLPTLVWHYDQPFGDSSMIPTYYVARAASEHVKVILSGDGGDELFAGYRKYADLVRLQHCDRLPGWLVGAARAFLPDSWHGRTRGWGRLVDGGNIRLMHSDERNYHWMAYFTRAEKRALYAPDMRWALGRDRSRDLYFDVVRSLHVPPGLNRVLLTDALTYLPDDLLVKMDVASMACSLEVRAPLLDHRLFEYCAGLPPAFKVGGHGTKHLLKRIGMRFLPAEIVRRPKQGFAIPVDQWLRGPLADFTREVLLEVPTGARNYFDQEAVGRLVEAHRSGQKNVGSTPVAPDQLLPVASHLPRTGAGMSQPNPLPVLFLIPSLERGGAEGQLIMLVNALDRRRFRPIVCSLSPVEPERRREIDCEVVHFGLTSLFRPSAVATLSRVEALVRQRGIRVIQAFFLRAEVLAVLARLAHRRRVSVVLAKRDLGHESYGWRERLLARLAHWGSDVLVSNADAVKSHLESAWQVAPDRSRVIHNGIVLERFAPASPERRAAVKRQLGFAPDEVVVTAVTHLTPVKGVGTVVEAAALVLGQMPHARFSVVGGGPLLPGLEERARSLGISAQIRFVGEVSDVRLHLEGSDVGALPSLSEGLPNAVLEYMAMGLPIVATEVGGTRELVGPDGECGFLVPGGRPAPLATRLLELIRDPGASRRMGERGRIRAERLFDARHMAQEYGELFDRLSARQDVEVSVHAPR